MSAEFSLVSPLASNQYSTKIRQNPIFKKHLFGLSLKNTSTGFLGDSSSSSK